MDRRLRRLIIRFGLLLVGWIVAVNAVVRYVGDGDTSLVSPANLADKSLAVLHFAKHLTGHSLAGERGDTLILLRHAAARYELPAELVVAVARAESNLRPHSISGSGAMGLMQLMPDTATELGVSDPFDQRQSAEAGARYLKRLWRMYGGRADWVAAAYNAGPASVPQSGRLPSESRQYVARVLSFWGR